MASNGVAILRDNIGLYVAYNAYTRFSQIARPKNNVTSFKVGDIVKVGVLGGKARPHPIMGVGKNGIDKIGIYNEYWEIVYEPNNSFIGLKKQQCQLERVRNGMFMDYNRGGFLPENFVKEITDITNIKEKEAGIQVFGYLVNCVRVAHNDQGPAIIYNKTKSVSFLINGYKIKLTRDYIYASDIDDELAVIMVLKYGDVLPKKL